MANDEDDSYCSSLVAIKLPLALAGLLMAFFLVQGLSRLLFHPLTDLQGPLAAGRIGMALLIGVVVGIICWAETGKKVTISSAKVVCEQGGRSFSIRRSDMVLHLPKKGQKTNRSILVSNGQQSMRINERFFPHFDYLLDDLKTFKGRS